MDLKSELRRALLLKAMDNNPGRYSKCFSFKTIESNKMLMGVCTENNGYQIRVPFLKLETQQAVLLVLAINQLLSPMALIFNI